MAATEASAAAVEETTAAQSVTALYIGDLDGGVTEEELSRLFDQIGDVISVKICRDQNTELSLGYGYVNYSNPQHAAKAIEDLNFTPLKGKRIRISYSNRDATLRKSGAGNIFVKNLDKEIDDKALCEIFSPFGNIISSKIESDPSGDSKGYGFVHYESEEAARAAIEQLNGVSMHGKVLYVGPFISKPDREKLVDKTRFTNVFVKNLSESTTEDDLRLTFGEFGPTTSVVIMRDEDGKSKCFGFVNFVNYEDAARSVEVLNGRTFDGKEWYVGKAQKKSERERELKLRHEQIAKEASDRSSGLNNLYVKNLDDEIDNEKLKELFTPYGSIISCKVMCDPRGISKGSGFVAFSTSQEASRAISEMNGKMVGRKPLYVAIAERKEVRKTRLQALFSNVLPSATVPVVTPPMPVYSPGVFYGHAPPAIIPPMPHFGYHQQLVPGVRPSRPRIPNVPSPMMQHGMPGPRPNGRRPPGANFVQHGRPPVPLMHPQMIMGGNAYRIPVGYGLPNVSAQVNNANVSTPVGTLASALANASPSEQRIMLGEILYPLVEKIEHEMAAKVTGMLLEMDQIEVLDLLESPESLRAKVVEAMGVLENAQSQHQASTTAEQLASSVLNE